MFCDIEREQNWRILKEIATVRTEETRKSGRPRKRWEKKDEEDLNITRKMKRQEVARDCREWREIVLGGKVHRGLWKRKDEEEGMRRRRRGRRKEWWRYKIKMVVVVVVVMKPMQYIFRLVARFLCYRPRFTPQVAHVDTVAIRQVSLRVLPHVLSVRFNHCSVLMHLLPTLMSDCGYLQQAKWRTVLQPVTLPCPDANGPRPYHPAEYGLL